MVDKKPLLDPDLSDIAGKKYVKKVKAKEKKDNTDNWLFLPIQVGEKIQRKDISDCTPDEFRSWCGSVFPTYIPKEKDVKTSKDRVKAFQTIVNSNSFGLFSRKRMEQVKH